MDEITKRRVVGAAVLVAIGVIFIPLFLKEQSPENGVDDSDLVDLDVSENLRLLEKIEPSESSLLLEQAKSFSKEVPLEIEDPVDIDSYSRNTGTEAPSKKGGQLESESVERYEHSLMSDSELGSDNKAWVLQFGSFRKETNAVKLLEQLRNRGYAAFIAPVDLDAGSLYKVRVGPQLERSESLRIRAQIESEFSIKGILITY